MKCEYNGCKEEAFIKLFDLVWLCKKHYLIVLDELSDREDAGRPKKIPMRRIFKWLKDKTFITISEFLREFNVTYPTASNYVRLLEKFGFLEKTGSVWKVIKTEKKEVVI
jgi:DNA-binding transcriptional ArsR family regulator